MSQTSQYSKELTEKVQLTGASVIKRLREIVAPHKKKRMWPAQLSDKHLAEIYLRLKKGQSPMKIARIAQVDWGIKAKSNTASLARAIIIIRDEAVGELEQKERGTKERKEDNLLSVRGKKIIEKLDGLGTLRWLISEQCERLQMWRDKENQAKIPFAAVENTVKELGVLVDKYLNLQIRLGLLDSKPSQFNLEIKHRFDGLMQNTIQNDGANTLEMTRGFLEDVENEALTFDYNEQEGEYKMPEEEAGKEQK